MERAKTVWIINKGGHPYAPAKRFGNLVPLTEGRINPFRPDRLALEASKKLVLAKQDDFLLLGGPPMLCCLVFFLWLSKFPTVNLLQWDAKEREYVVKTMDGEELQKLAEKIGG